MSDLNLSIRVVLAVVLGLLAVGLAVAFSHRPQAAPGSGVEPDVVIEGPVVANPTASELLTLHVSGAVVYPGLVVVVDGGRVADAIAAAGGAAPGADLAAVNLAALVVDGMQLRVPAAGESLAGNGPNDAFTSDGMIDVNRASISELTELPGVGAVLAARIVAYRESHGLFESVDDLLDVSGIGEGKLAGMRDLAAVR